MIAIKDGGGSAVSGRGSRLLQPISFAAVEYLCLNMRARDGAEIFGMRPHDNPLLLAHEVLAAAVRGRAQIAFHAGRPAAIVGVTSMWPRVWTIWAFGTDAWREVAVDVARHARNDLKPWLLKRGAHRVQCESRFDHVEAHALLERFGAVREAVLKSYGRDGADYFLYAWRREDVLCQAEYPRPETGAVAARPACGELRRRQ